MKSLKIYSFLVLIVALFLAKWGYAQEINASVIVNSKGISQPDQPIFKTLETSIQEFYNNTKWTDQKFREEEKVDCSIIFIVTEYNNDRFKGTLQVSVSRPVYNSAYSTPIFNYKDQDIVFDYVEFAPLYYNDNQFETNLISLLSYYAYTFLGLDADTYALRGGQKFHEEAQNIVNLAQGNSGAGGWNPSDGLISRYRLNDDILSDTYKEFREVLYQYHRKGMDTFAGDQKFAKSAVKKYILRLNDLQDRRPNSLLQRVFFDAKADEISSIFSGGPTMDIKDLKESLLKLSPNQSSKWRSIKV